MKEEKELNRQKLKSLSRVEQVFEFMGLTMGRQIFSEVGLIRATPNVKLVKHVYSICRLMQIKEYKTDLITIQQSQYQTITRHPIQYMVKSSSSIKNL